MPAGANEEQSLSRIQPAELMTDFRAAAYAAIDT